MSGVILSDCAFAVPAKPKIKANARNTLAQLDIDGSPSQLKAKPKPPANGETCNQEIKVGAIKAQSLVNGAHTLSGDVGCPLMTLSGLRLFKGHFER